MYESIIGIITVVYFISFGLVLFSFQVESNEAEDECYDEEKREKNP